MAGQFYPEQPDTLRETVSALLSEKSAGWSPGATPATRSSVIKAIVAPHAGYIYSGALAAQVYARLKPLHSTIKKVVLLGPSHRVGFHGIAASSADYYRTPLGDIPLDQQALQAIRELPGVQLLDEAHAREHSLEVQLPFLQSVLDGFSLLPLVIGQASAGEVARVLQHIWGGPETLVVISTDLSHFHNYQEARAIDADTAGQIEALRPELTGEQACGARALNGLLLHLQREQLFIHRVDIVNSGDTAGDKKRVVGYGAWYVDGAR